MSFGLMALEEGSRVDFASLRRARLQKLLASMEESGVDALFLGRPANIRYASGARQLWTAGARPFAPGCVVMRESAQVHLLSTWDEGVPAEVGRENLFGISWDPVALAAALRAIPGMGLCRRAATDSLSPLFEPLLATVVPDAEIVDGAGLVGGCRMIKTAGEIDCITTAAALAESVLARLVSSVAPGVTERQLLGMYVESLSSLGVPTPPSEAVAFATPRQGGVGYRQVATDRPVGPGELVVLTPGAMYAGYEAGVARTVTVGGSWTRRGETLMERARSALAALVAACRPGGSGSDLLDSWEATGEPPPPLPLAHGVGLGAEAPVIGLGHGRSAPLVAGMVLVVQAWVAAEGVGGALLRETVLLSEEGPVVLTRFDAGAPHATGGSGARNHG